MGTPEGAGRGVGAVTGLRHGAFLRDDARTRFSVWAPRAQRVDLVLGDEVAGALDPTSCGYHVGVFAAPAGTRYRYLLDGRGPFADPASRSQPDGVHGPSEVVVRHLADPVASWRGVPLGAQVICEVHVGTFAATGTFDGVAAALDHLAGAGYNVIELMPVSAFPGDRNWGYDGVFPFAVHVAYGGRRGLARLCGAAHRRGVAVVLDVVYNHFGPEGFVFDEFGPYTTDRYRTPWGDAVNVDGEGSDEVRRFFVEHALSAVRELGVDGFRLDAVHAITDRTASPFVAELGAAVHAESRRIGRVLTVVAESPDDDPRLPSARSAGGMGLDGVWNDDFHHALRVTLTGQSDRYFGDYDGVGDFASACTDGFVVAGRVSPSRGRLHGARPAEPLCGDRLVVFAQNHDQIGNGGFGRRLAAELPPAAQFPVAAAVLCSGWVPLRFMGEEYGETAPFHYFTDHQDPALAAAVRRGRSEEIGASGPSVPDPQDPETFSACRPDRSLARVGVHRELLAWQRLLLELRRAEPALGSLEPARSACWYDASTRSWVLLRRADRFLGGRPIAVAATMRDEPATLRPELLAGCRLEVLAARGAHDVADAQDVPRLELEPYGVLIAAVVSSVGGAPRGSATRFGPWAPRPGDPGCTAPAPPAGAR
ncbi:MAG: malto-oligosyltrehalose trehalohydrolase [Actinomycetota bacterium]|nr:malto-oligosyltrehalose trehalohydrolase [Actinomycetota bacterium]